MPCPQKRPVWSLLLGHALPCPQGEAAGTTPRDPVRSHLAVLRLQTQGTGLSVQVQHSPRPLPSPMLSVCPSLLMLGGCHLSGTSLAGSRSLGSSRTCTCPFRGTHLLQGRMCLLGTCRTTCGDLAPSWPSCSCRTMGMSTCAGERGLGWEGNTATLGGLRQEHPGDE